MMSYVLKHDGSCDGEFKSHGSINQTLTSDIILKKFLEVF